MTSIQLAGCIILDNRGQLLLIHRRTEAYDHWEIAGGKMEQGETSAQTAVRELSEELDLQVVVQRELGTAAFSDNQRHYSYTWWLATARNIPRIAEPYIFSEWRYFSLEELQSGEIALSEGLKSFLGLVENGKITL
jgi:mutator protein MutT